MEKAASIEIDLDEWEFLPDDRSFLSFGHESGKSFFSGEPCCNPKGINIHVDVDYFNRQTQPPRFLEARKDDPVDPGVEKYPDDVQDQEFKDIGVVPPVIAADRDLISQVFFKKLKENEFAADMKMDSPNSTTKGVVRQIDMPPIPFEDKEEVAEDECFVDKLDQSSLFKEEDLVKEKDHAAPDAKEKTCCQGFHFALWGWRFKGIGAICSMGVAAATLCALMLGGQKQQHHQNQKLQLQIYTDEKRIKQVVQQATRLNQALSAVRGTPVMTRAHISFGGCYDGL